MYLDINEIMGGVLISSGIWFVIIMICKIGDWIDCNTRVSNDAHKR